MRILHAIESLNPAAGGPVHALLGLARAQSKLGHDVHIVAGHRPNEETIEAELTEDGAKVSCIETDRGRVSYWARGFAETRRLVGSVDILHSHGLWQFVPTMACEFAKWQNVPYVVRPCGMLDSWSLAQNRWVKMTHVALITRPLLNRASLLHSTTEAERREVEKLGLHPRIVVVSNGVDELAFHAETTVLPTELEMLRRTRRILLFFGRIHAKKGLDILIRAMSLVQTPQATLVVMGPRTEGYYREVRAQIEQLGIQDRVRFLSPLYGAARFGVFASAELFVLPSKQENFGVAAAEAMACALPVIVSPEVALSDMVRASEAGLVVSREPQALATSIDCLLANDELRRSMGENGRRTAIEQFRWSAIAKRWQDEYASLAAASE